MPPIEVRSWPSSAFATVQPPFTSPMTWWTGVRTSWKKVSQKGEAPLISRIGRTSTPGDAMSTRMKVMPRCFFTSGLVRTSMKIQSA